MKQLFHVFFQEMLDLKRIQYKIGNGISKTPQ